MAWIETIRNKPQEVKVRIMWGVSIVVLILLVVVWIVSVKIAKRNYANKGELQKAADTFNSEKNYYQTDLQQKGIDVPDKFKPFK